MLEKKRILERIVAFRSAHVNVRASGVGIGSKGGGGGVGGGSVAAGERAAFCVSFAEWLSRLGWRGLEFQ